MISLGSSESSKYVGLAYKKSFNSVALLKSRLLKFGFWVSFTREQCCHASGADEESKESVGELHFEQRMFYCSRTEIEKAKFACLSLLLFGKMMLIRSLFGWK